MGQTKERAVRHTVFFDLDGTLLPLDMDPFFGAYMDEMRKSGALDVIHRDRGEEIFSKAIYAMLGNNGAARNKDVFFATIEALSGVSENDIMPYFDSFYQDRFFRTKEHTRTEKRVRKTVDVLKQKGYRLVLATNPLFPPVATDQRIAWAGLLPGDFEYVSYYDNSSYCKPSPEYYNEILDALGLCAKACYIVGNDVKEDMSAIALGFEGFLVLDHVIGDPERIPQECKKGDYSALLDFAKSLPPI
jgi:FMN phosphatase YigB (HAD superfamily)